MKVLPKQEIIRFYLLYRSKSVRFENKTCLNTSFGGILRVIVCKNHPIWNLGVHRSSWDHFFRILHAKLWLLAKSGVNWTNISQNF